VNETLPKELPNTAYYMQLAMELLAVNEYEAVKVSKLGWHRLDLWRWRIVYVAGLKPTVTR
jgi:hypothetical protein